MRGFNRPYVRNFWSIFQPIYFPGENYSFYINSEKLVNSATISDFGLYILDYTEAQISFISVMSRVNYPSTTGYDLYLDSFVFPFISDGNYYFQVYDMNIGVEIMRSNPIIINSSSIALDRTSFFKFRHNDQLFGFRYDLLPNFYQLFRLTVNQIKAPEVRSQREQYRESSNDRDLVNSKSFRDIILTMEVYWASDEDIEAFSAMLEHTEIYINDYRIISMNQIKSDKPTEISNLQKGTFEIIVNDYDLPDKLDNYGDIILIGGSIDEIDTFIQG